MKRTSPLRAKPKVRRVANPMKAGALGESAARKGPIYSKDHLDLVRAQQCLVTRSHGCVAHHAREFFPRTAGKRITDFCALPLRPDVHDGEDYSLHKTGQKSGEPAWWAKNGYTADRVFQWLRVFFSRHYPAGHPGVAQALEMIAAEERKASA